jgi:hypothetical protein
VLAVAATPVTFTTAALARLGTCATPPTRRAMLSPAPTVVDAVELVPRRVRVSRMREGFTGRNSAPLLLASYQPATSASRCTPPDWLRSRTFPPAPTLTITTFGTPDPGRTLMLLTSGGAASPDGVG